MMLWYIASPYGDEDKDLMQRRFDQVCATAAQLMREGLFVLSPIAHSHPIAQYGLPVGWDYWKQVDIQLLERCDGLIVVMIDGWAESRGVSAEIGWAALNGYPIRYQAPVGGA